MKLKKALIGTKIPFTSMNPVINHCAVEVDTLNSFINGGNATLIIVWFKNRNEHTEN